MPPQTGTCQPPALSFRMPRRLMFCARAMIARLLAMLALEARKPGVSFEEVLERPVEIDAGLLQGHAVIVGQPGIAPAPFGDREQLPKIVLGRKHLAVHAIAVHLDRQSLVAHETHNPELPVEKLNLLGRRIQANLRGAEHSPSIEQTTNIAKLQTWERTLAL